MRRIFELADKITSCYDAGCTPEPLQTVAFTGKCFLCDKPTVGNTQLVISAVTHEDCYGSFQQEVQSVRESIFEDNRARILIMMAAGLLVRDVRGIIARHMLHMDPSEPYRLMSLVKFPTPPQSVGPDLVSLICKAAADRLVNRITTK